MKKALSIFTVLIISAAQVLHAHNTKNLESNGIVKTSIDSKKSPVKSFLNKDRLGMIQEVGFNHSLRIDQSSMSVIGTLLCNNATFSATATINAAYNGIVKLPYLSGDGTSYPQGSSIASYGVTGLSAVLQAGTLANGDDSLTYIITGTPTATGNANFLIDFGGQSCVMSLVVNNVIVVNPSIASLICDSAKLSAPLCTNIYNYATALIPYDSGNGGVVSTNGRFIRSTGVTRLFAYTLADTLANGAGFLRLLIFGTPTTTGIASFNLTYLGKSCTINVPVIATSIADLKCGAATFSARVYVDTPNYVIAMLPYDSGNGGIDTLNYTVIDDSIHSSGVTGLTAFTWPDTLSIGSGYLKVVIFGKPTSTGLASFAINYFGKQCTLSIPVIDANGFMNTGFDFTVNPNPAKEYISLSLNSPTDIVNHVWIYDAVGKLMISLSKPDLTNGINISNLPKGVYFIKLLEDLGKKVVTKKFVKY
jgi:hypothetical protein